MTDAERLHLISTLALTNGGGLAAIVTLIAGSMSSPAIFTRFAPKALFAGLAYVLGETGAVFAYIDLSVDTPPPTTFLPFLVRGWEIIGAAVFPLVGTAMITRAVLKTIAEMEGGRL